MERENKTVNPASGIMDQPEVMRVLNELGRSINLVTTYGKNHPASQSAIDGTAEALNTYFRSQRRITVGAYNGVMTVDEKTISTSGSLQKSLERRLLRLGITGLKIDRGITREELIQLTELLTSSDADSFEQHLGRSGLNHIASESTTYQAVRDGQTVANMKDLAGAGSVLVLEDGAAGTADGGSGSNLHVEQIVAFLKGDIDADQGEVSEELTRLASSPDELGRMIMESVSIRQTVTDLQGESLNDIILGCLRRTYDGLRKQPAFRSSEGKAELKKALLLLEESLLDKMRGLAGEEDPELDRQIVQSIREMDENLDFEIAAAEYIEHREAIAQSKEHLHRYIQVQGTEAAEQLLKGSGFPGSDWRRIVIESGRAAGGSTSLPDGLSTLTTVFEQLEKLMKSKATDGTAVKDLLGRANENLDDTLGTTREKLAVLSSTIGGQAHTMSRAELLSALAEVAQELMQPLTAINASLEMMLEGYVGGITRDQHDLLKLASNSGEHLKYLMDMLIQIVGCPANKGIDNRFHTTSEQVQLLKDAEGQGHLPLHLG